MNSLPFDWLERVNRAGYRPSNMNARSDLDGPG